MFRRSEITEARVAVLRRGDDVEMTLKTLAEFPEDGRYSQEDQELLLGTLAVSALQVGAFDLAETLCRRFADFRPDNLYVRLLLFDLALRSQKTDVMQSVLNEIREIEGEGDATTYYGQAGVLFNEARRADQSTTAIEELCNEAVLNLYSAAEDRPKWNAIPKLHGEIELLRDNPNGAIEFFQRSIDWGNRDPELIGRVVALLHAAGRYREADDELVKLQNTAIPFSDEFGRLAADLSLRVDDYVDAAPVRTASRARFRRVRGLGGGPVRWPDCRTMWRGGKRRHSSLTPHSSSLRSDPPLGLRWSSFMSAATSWRKLSS